MMLCLLMTRPGRHAMGFCISSIWPRWNDRATDRIMRQHPGFSNRIVMRRQMAEDMEAHQSRINHAGLEFTFAWTSAGNGNGNNDTNAGGREVLLRVKTHRYNNKSFQGEAVRDLIKQPFKAGEETESTICMGQEDTDVKDDHNREDNDDASSVVSSTELVVCPICHTDIEDGDRVGDLLCKHVMHIECLKTWIVRRNVCPLCLAEDIATPRQEVNSSNQQTYDNQGDPLPYSNRAVPLPELVVTGE
jgi:Ring finger domain